MNYSNKTVILTGASGGIGQAIARRFAALGTNLALLGNSHIKTQALAEELGLDQKRVFYAGLDISDEMQVKKTIDNIKSKFNQINVLINAAGISGPSARLEDYSSIQAKKVLDVNFFGTFFMMQNVLPIMQKQKQGVILNFGSVSGTRAYAFESAYGASKAAVIQLTKNAANENGSNGVRINCISPGWVKTSMMSDILASYKDVGFENGEDNVTVGPMGRIAEPEEVAAAVVFLCSDEASYINGGNYLVDGGMSLG